MCVLVNRMTVTVTAEHYILVVFPISARRWSTMTNANLLIVFIAVVAIAFHSFNLFSLDTKATLCHTDANIIVYTLMTKSELGNFQISIDAFRHCTSAV